MASTSEEGVGNAWLADNGTLVVQLKVIGASGRPDRLFREFAPDHPKFARIVELIGGIGPAETKIVPSNFDEDLFL